MINIAILGFGVVGSGVVEVVTQNFSVISKKINNEINIKYILDKKDFSGHPLEYKIVKDIDIILNDSEIDIIVELMGGSHPAYEFCDRALRAGKSVVTSNKEVVSNFGDKLLEVAKENNVCYLFEASVGGGIPIIRPINQCLAANEIDEVDGILNGTTNYILTQMVRSNKSFDVALKEAQSNGYAEANPTADIDGIDTCRKICILSALAFGKLIPTQFIYTEGITKIALKDIENAAKFNSVIKLIGRAKKLDENKIFIMVSPCILKNNSPLSNIENVYNGILVKGNAIGDVMFYGKGAGKLPTASAVVADIIDIIKHIPTQLSQNIWTKAEEDYVCDYKTMKTAMYINLRINNTSDVLKNIFDNIKDLFGSFELIDTTENEIAFVTNEMLESEIDCKLIALEKLDCTVLSQIRVL